MKWLADQQRIGTFGWTPPPLVKDRRSGRVTFADSIPAQPRWRARVNIEQALMEAEGLLLFWHQAARHPTTPAFSGGLLDGWPSWAVDALPIAQQESAAIDLFLEYRRLKKE